MRAFQAGLGRRVGQLRVAGSGPRACRMTLGLFIVEEDQNLPKSTVNGRSKYCEPRQPMGYKAGGSCKRIHRLKVSLSLERVDFCEDNSGCPIAWPAFAEGADDWRCSQTVRNQSTWPQISQAVVASLNSPWRTGFCIVPLLQPPFRRRILTRLSRVGRESEMARIHVHALGKTAITHPL